ncbi:MAG: hydroxyacylglutathione hydrolase [Geminicoccaceae bacterium]|nr:hydroxyacylglutathione hydrolase [Geminicoccaceae bacterium]
MAELQVERIPALSDNYMFLLFDPVSGTSGIVDPADAGPVIEALERHDRSLDWILNTHHHADHTAGNGDLMQRYGARLAGPAGDHSRIAGMDILLREGEAFTFGSHKVDILETPGHTSGHVSLHFADAGMLFSGDTLFALGCGRLFEGSPAQMWESLSKYAAMPDETIVWCGHEYTLANARFALTVDPDNPALRERAREIEALRSRNEPTVPTTLGLERRTNPFLRPDDPSIRRTLGLERADDIEVFAEIRRRKDSF